MDKTRVQVHPPPGPRYYHATNQVGSGIFFWLPAVGGGGAVVLGAAYAFVAYLAHVIDESPWLVIVTPFFAAGLVVPARWACHLGNVRKRRLRLPLALCVGAIGLYAAWHIYLNFAASDTPGIFDPRPTWHMSPLRLWRAMRDVAEDRGISIWLAWLIEAVTVYGFIVYMMGESDPEVPFCEHCGHWTDVAFSFELDEGHSSAVDEFKQGHVEKLRKLGPRKTSAKSYLQVRVLRCPCLASRFACIEQVSIKPGKKGGWRFYRMTPASNMAPHYDLGTGETNEVSPIVTNMEIDAEMQEKLETIRTELLKAK